MSSIITAPPPAGGPARWPGPDGGPLTVEQYVARARAGAYGDARVELLDGWVYRKMTQYPRHKTAVRLTHDALVALMPAGFDVERQVPIELARSMPEPDVYVQRGTPMDYLLRHPTPADLPLVVEVSDSTLRTDRRRKRPLYAAAGIPVLWIVNLVHDQVEVYSDPDPAARTYRVPQIYAVGEDVPLVIDGQAVGAVAVADVIAALPGP